MKDKHGYTVGENLGYSLAIFFIFGLTAISVMYFALDMNLKQSALTIILYFAFMTWFSIVRYVYMTNYDQD